MRRFFTYEEYGAHWTTMSQDLTTTCKGLQGWNEYERGVEALSKLVASENNRESSSRKALGFSDLLIKVRILPSRVKSSNVCTSPFNVSASTRYYLKTSVVILRCMMILRHMRSSRKHSFDFRKRFGRLTRRKTTQGRGG